MPIVIAGGPSVTDYDKLHLQNLARCAFTFGVNGACWDFPCDVIVSCDPDMFKYEYEEIAKLGKPIITRRWEGFKERYPKLDLIELPNACITKAYYTGMVATKLADRLAKTAGDRKSYVVGMDATDGNYKGYRYTPTTHLAPHEELPHGSYEALNCQSTINLSVKSKISCWPKQSKLPKIEKVLVSNVYRVAAIAWLRINAEKVIME